VRQQYLDFLGPRNPTAGSHLLECSAHQCHAMPIGIALEHRISAAFLCRRSSRTGFIRYRLYQRRGSADNFVKRVSADHAQVIRWTKSGKRAECVRDGCAARKFWGIAQHDAELSSMPCCKR